MNANGVSWMAGLVAAVATALVLPAARRSFLRRGWVDEPGVRKIHGTSTPLAGGLAVFLGILAGLAAGAMGWAGLSGAGDGWNAAGGALDVRLELLLIAGLFLVGGWDDLADLPPRVKFLGQLLLAVLVVGSGLRFPVTSGGPVVQVLATGLFFLATVNALNFLDNMNGLCAGLGCIAAAQLALMAGRLDQPGLAIQAWALSGACAGFLPFNFPRASTFLGDSGSHVIGGLLAVLTLKVCAGSAAGVASGGTMPFGPFAPLWVLAVPAFDLVQVVIGRWRRGQPVYVGDNAHLSHLLNRAGLSRVTAVLLLWLIAALAGWVGVMTVPVGRGP